MFGVWVIKLQLVWSPEEHKLQGSIPQPDQEICTAALHRYVNPQTHTHTHLLNHSHTHTCWCFSIPYCCLFICENQNYVFLIPNIIYKEDNTTWYFNPVGLGFYDTNNNVLLHACITESQLCSWPEDGSKLSCPLVGEYNSEQEFIVRI